MGRRFIPTALAQHLPANWHWLLWLRHEWPYAEKSTYASGYLLWFVALLPVVVSPLVFPFTIIGTVCSLQWRELARNHIGRCQMLIALIPLMILTVHSLLYWLGRMASNGEIRYMLVVAPFGCFWRRRDGNGCGSECGGAGPTRGRPLRRCCRSVCISTIRCCRCIYRMMVCAARETARWYRSDHISIDYPRMLVSDPEVAYFMGVSHTDRGWLREWKKETAAAAPPGTILIWDPIYAMHNADANRVVTIAEIQRAGWIERPDLAGPLNDVCEDGQWRVFLSPKSIFGKVADRP